MKTSDLVQMHINSLTEDNDLRQELWVTYLEGASLSDLSDQKIKIEQEEQKYQQMKSAFQYILDNPPSDFFHEILSNFTSVEQEVLCMLALGCEINEISQYNSISEVRLRQMVVNIRNSNIWEEIYGTQERAQ